MLTQKIVLHERKLKNSENWNFEFLCVFVKKKKMILAKSKGEMQPMRGDFKRGDDPPM